MTVHRDVSVLNVADFGMLPQETGGVNRAAFVDCIAASVQWDRPIGIPDGEYDIEGDIVIDDWNHRSIYGYGQPNLKFNNGGLVIAPTAGTMRSVSLVDLRFSRTGSSGPAISVVGNRGTGDPIRWTWRNITVDGSTGDGLFLSGAYLGSIHGLWIRQCPNGAAVKSRPGNTLGLNSITIQGGELQTSGNGMDLVDTKACTLYGVAIEGNDREGVLLESDNRAFLCSGGYFENNYRSAAGGGGHDVVIRDGAIPNKNIKFDTCFFSDGSVGHTRAVNIEDNQQSIEFHNCRFWAYGSHAIRHTAGLASTSTGRAIGCTSENGGGTIPVSWAASTTSGGWVDESW